MKSGQDLGGRLIDLSVLVWLSISVGPWWVGVLLFMAGIIVNLSGTLVTKAREAECDTKRKS